jgi:rhamnose utilization protein RhaD (predicted bifunctional aldolase and dehydrogenase)
LQELFKDIKYNFIEYAPPGLELVNKLKPLIDQDNIFLLQNHGLIVGADSFDNVVQITELIDNRCKKWLADCIDPYIESSNRQVLPLFPDAAVFREELDAINNYILKLMDSANLTPNFLTEDQIRMLCNMPAEQFRKAQV